MLPGVLKAQSSLYERYIGQYSSMAVDQMHRYGVPASITLAQGLLESAAGTSRLATKGNNHFGIKCGGERPVYAHDRRRTERKIPRVWQRSRKL